MGQNTYTKRCHVCLQFGSTPPRIQGWWSSTGFAKMGTSSRTYRHYYRCSWYENRSGDLQSLQNAQVRMNTIVEDAIGTLPVYQASPLRFPYLLRPKLMTLPSFSGSLHFHKSFLVLDTPTGPCIKSWSSSSPRSSSHTPIKRSGSSLQLYYLAERSEVCEEGKSFPVSRYVCLLSAVITRLRVCSRVCKVNTKAWFHSSLPAGP